MTATLQNANLPVDTPLVYLRTAKEKLPGFISDLWLNFLTVLLQVLNQAPNRVGQQGLTAQDASLGATDLTSGGAGAGLYRVTYYARVTTAATVSSSLTVTIAFTDHGTAQSTSGAAITGNTTTTKQSGSFLLYSDAASPITVATTYASVGATAMVYQLYVTLEAMNASVS